MEKKQSSIDSFVQQLKRKGLLLTEDSEYIVAYLKAKAMHKEEMRDLYLTHVTKAERLRKIFEKQFEELYNETFGGE